MRRILFAASLMAGGLVTACAPDGRSPAGPVDVVARTTMSGGGSGTYGDGSGPLVTPTFLANAINDMNSLRAVCLGGEGMVYKLDTPGGPEGDPIAGRVNVTLRGELLDWEPVSGVTVHWVRMKGGEGENVYAYNPPPATFDNGLVTPTNPNNNTAFGLSHYSICFSGEPVQQRAIIAVEKTANTRWHRDWVWTIEKSADPTELRLLVGQSGSIDYDVVVKGASASGGYTVYGTITVSNAGTAPAAITSVTDDLQEGAAVTCSVSLPHVLAAGGSFGCDYEVEVSDGSAGTNTATVTVDPIGGVPVQGDLSSEPVNYSFTVLPTTETDRCVSLTDSYVGHSLPASVCGAANGADFEENYEYTREVGPYTAASCNTTTDLLNTASVTVLNDLDDVLDSDDATVRVLVTCGGCTPGYWSNSPGAFPAGLTPSTFINANAALGAAAFPNPTFSALGDNPFSTAFTWSSGNQVQDMARQMLRHASAGLLNALTPSVMYPLSTDQIRERVSAAMLVGTRGAFEALKDELDGYNNLGCSLRNQR
jgi:hypothetical protein